MTTSTKIADLLSLSRRPVGIKFQASAPENISQIDDAAAAGCSYWKLAADGQTFFTEASDHYGCPIGSHTHGIDLPAETAQELDGMVRMMVDMQYIAMDEVPNIPRLDGPFGVAIYAPLDRAEFEPDVVLISGNAKQMMMLAEAAHAVGLTSEPSVVGRPTCAAIPAVMKSGQIATNLGCIGNRVYTELADDDLYFVVAGQQLDRVADKLETIVNANSKLEAFHLERVGSGP